MKELGQWALICLELAVIVLVVWVVPAWIEAGLIW